MAKIGVIGAGSWGTALALLMHNNGHQVTIWSIIGAEVEMLRTKRQHETKLPGVLLPEAIEITGNLEEAMSGKDVLILAVPSPFTRSTACMMKEFLKANQKIVNVAKGIEENTLYTLSDVIEEELPCADVAVLSGPSHAEEVGRCIPTACVIATEENDIAKMIQKEFMNPNFRLYTNSDVIGVEIGAALKNIIALAAGMSDGLGFGDNTKAALMTRGMTEMSRLGIAMGGKAETFAGLSGIGDLIVTCTSMHSRNRRAGILLGKGKSLDETLAEVKMVVEGINTVQAACELAKKYHVSMPITEEINQVLFHNKNVREAVLQLMTRDGKAE